MARTIRIILATVAVTSSVIFGSLYGFYQYGEMGRVLAKLAWGTSTDSTTSIKDEEAGADEDAGPMPDFGNWSIFGNKTIPYNAARDELFGSVVKSYPVEGTLTDKTKWAQDSANAWIKLEKEQAKTPAALKSQQQIVDEIAEKKKKTVCEIADCSPPKQVSPPKQKTRCGMPWSWYRKSTNSSTKSRFS